VENERYESPYYAVMSILFLFFLNPNIPAAPYPQTPSVCVYFETKQVFNLRKIWDTCDTRCLFFF